MIEASYYTAPKAADYAEAMQRGNAYAERAAEARAVAAAILPEFNGKKCGEKTREKINAAAKARGWSFYFSGYHGAIMHKLTPEGHNDRAGSVEFSGEFLNSENILNAATITTAAAYCGEGYRADVRADKILTPDELSRTADELSSAATVVFAAIAKAAEAVKAYNAIAKNAPNVASICGHNLTANGYAHIEIIG